MDSLAYRLSRFFIFISCQCSQSLKFQMYISLQKKSRLQYVLFLGYFANFKNLAKFLRFPIFYSKCSKTTHVEPLRNFPKKYFWVREKKIFSPFRSPSIVPFQLSGNPISFLAWKSVFLKKKSLILQKWVHVNIKTSLLFSFRVSLFLTAIFTFWVNG